MSKSIGYEIIALLWFILAAVLVTGPLFWISVVMGAYNIVASMAQSHYESRD